jgi:hypothetical protein
MRQPETYRQWVKQQGKVEEMGTKALLTDKMLRQLTEAKIPEIIAPTLAIVLANGFVKNGVRPPPGFEQWIEKDLSLRATEYGVIIESVQGKLPIEYLSLAYNTWQKGYAEVKEWENKSLLGYLEYWSFKTKGKKRLHKKVRDLMDYINPDWES